MKRHFRFVVHKKKVIAALLDDVLFSLEDIKRHEILRKEYLSFCKEYKIKTGGIYADGNRDDSDVVRGKCSVKPKGVYTRSRHSR